MGGRQREENQPLSLSLSLNFIFSKDWHLEVKGIGQLRTHSEPCEKQSIALIRALCSLWIPRAKWFVMVFKPPKHFF